MATRISNWWKRRKHPAVWAIKQLDESLLHVCGQATLQGQGSAGDKLKQASSGTFRGAVRMAGNGAMLNAAQFAALIPQADLRLTEDNQAEWQGRRWQIAWVPQRCWLHDGRLTAQHAELNGQPCLLSVEAVGDIRAKTNPPVGHNVFIALDPLEQPYSEHDTASPKRRQRTTLGDDRRDS